MNIKVLVVGYGSIGQRHAEVLSSISVVDEIHIVSKQEKLPYKTFHSLDKIPDLWIYDYFVIASETILHYSQLVYINSIVKEKIILVEKPLSTTGFDIDLNNDIFVAYNLRFHPVINELAKLLKNEEVLNINIQTGQYLPTWRPNRDYTTSYSALEEKGGGVLLDLSHEIDYLVWLFGEFKSIYSINEKISDLKINTDDYFTAIGKMKSGAYFNMTMDYISKITQRNININTNNYTIKADLVNNQLEYSDYTCAIKNIDIKVSDRNYTYLEMHNQILINKQSSNAASFSEGLYVLSIIDKVRRGKL